MNLWKQISIPVGCVLSAAVTVMGVPARGGGVPACGGGGGVPARGRVYVSRGVYLPGTCVFIQALSQTPS